MGSGNTNYSCYNYHAYEAGQIYQSIMPISEYWGHADIIAGYVCIVLQMCCKGSYVSYESHYRWCMSCHAGLIG